MLARYAKSTQTNTVAYFLQPLTMAKGKAYVGTSGWLYKHWRGTYYPKGLSQKDEFNYYSLFFNTVELNNPFYRLPSRETFENWKNCSGKNFLYIVKASRFITHMKKLKDTKEALDLFLHNCDGLEEKLGPILFQLPPGWQVNLERFETFLKQLPKGYRFAFEFRNPTWYITEVYDLLKKYKCAFCIYQLAGHMSPIEVTADWVYLRLHGPTKNKYQGSYEYQTLKAWAEKASSWQKAGKDVYIYFDNDDSGFAAFNAQVIEMMLNKKEPITEHEANVLSIVVQAIKEKKKIKFWYESTAGSYERIVEPYLIAIKDKGQGNIFFTGYQYPDTNSKRKQNSNNNQGQYLLKEIDLKKFIILDEEFEKIHNDIAKEKIFGILPTIRIIYRVVIQKSRSSKR
jgi:uncharacterized protein YecE (DUF72 family)